MNAPLVVICPVPPFATASVPASVMVPLDVTGLPLVVNPVAPPETETEVTVPALDDPQDTLVPFVVNTFPLFPD